MFVEAVMGAGGAMVPPKGYFEAITAVLDKYGIYLVDNGRINVAAMTPGNMDYLTTAIAAVLNGK